MRGVVNEGFYCIVTPCSHWDNCSGIAPKCRGNPCANLHCCQHKFRKTKPAREMDQCGFGITSCAGVTV